MKSRSLVGVALLLSAGSLPAETLAQCTDTDQAREVIRAARARARCNDKILRNGPTYVCPPLPPPPACAGTLVTDAIALAYGANNPPSAGVDPALYRDQLRCQQKIGRGVSRFIGGKLRHLIKGRTRAEAEARARGGLDRMTRRCDVPVIQDGSVVLPAVGAQCQLPVGAPGSAIEPEELRDCLITVLEGRVDQVAPGPPPVRPNLIIILSDDQRWDTLDETHQSPVRPGPVMPILTTELVNSGVSFENGFVTRALCCPSRASILKGQYAHTTGVYRNQPPNGGAISFDDTSTIATWLNADGYRTGLFGKYLNGYADLWPSGGTPYVPPGWDEWHAFEGSKFYDYYLIEKSGAGAVQRNFYDDLCVDQSTACRDQCAAVQDPANYSTDVLFAQANDFIEDSVMAGQPFFLYLAPFAPHAPSCTAKRHLGLFDTVPDWRPPNYDEGGDESDKPQWIQNRCPMSQTLKDDIDADRILMLGSLQAIDEGVGALMAKLRTLGQDDNTLVIYTADNGFAWGEHCRRAKSCAYEECARVPLVARYPVLEPDARVEKRFGLNIDFALTFAELAGLVPPIETDGRSLTRVIAKTERVWRTDFLFEHWDNDDNPDSGIPTLACVRNNVFKWVEYDNPAQETELYHLLQDPFELSNQTNNPAYQDEKAELAARLRELRPDWP